MSEARVVLLGPQRLKPTLHEAVTSLGVEGRIATVTAGWQEREREDQELDEHLEGRTANLELYRRAEELFSRDPELARAHRERQERLRQTQELYDLRLSYAMAACAALLGRSGDVNFLGPARLAAIEAVRALDSEHLDRVRRIHGDFDSRWKPSQREEVARERESIAAVLRDCHSLAVAGGHVAILLNRLRLFGFEELAQGRTVLAWSAGAMAISERVVLFHDNPPQGPGNAEVLEQGLGLARGIVPLPHARRRLQLEDELRVALFARRFAPAVSVALEDGARLELDGQGGWTAARGVQRLREDGDLELLGAA